MSDIWQYVHTRRHRQQRQRLEAEKKEVMLKSSEAEPNANGLWGMISTEIISL